MKKLIIAGDSLSMPRPKEGVEYEDTYPALLQVALQNEWWVINRAKRANNSRKQALYLNISDDVHDMKPDAFIYHIGTADCAPRLFSEFQQKLLDRVPPRFRKKIIGYFSKRRWQITKKYPKVFVSREDYEGYVLKVVKTAKAYTNMVFVLGIGMMSARVLGRSYGFRENIIKYNEALQEVCRQTGAIYIDTANLIDPDRDLLEDGIHYDKTANIKVFEVIMAQMDIMKPGARNSNFTG
ncbi:MAG TPA: SGNH/GDSL hydrolase family protein [Flavisolibacter sp.]